MASTTPNKDEYCGGYAAYCAKLGYEQDAGSRIAYAVDSALFDRLLSDYLARLAEMAG
jgi:hypothetical protein